MPLGEPRLGIPFVFAKGDTFLGRCSDFALGEDLVNEENVGFASGDDEVDLLLLAYFPDARGAGGVLLMGDCVKGVAKKTCGGVGVRIDTDDAPSIFTLCESVDEPTLSTHRENEYILERS